VYVDFMWPLGAQPDAAASPRPFRMASAMTPRAVEPTPRTVAPRPDAPTAPTAQADAKNQQQYIEAIRPIVDRMTEIKPFLVSAAQSGSPDVLKALDATLASLDNSLKGIHAPASAADQHLMLTTVVRTARRALDPAFTGDRHAQALQAVSMFESSTVAVTPAGQ
jgi:hypothetical protein